ncbi:MAG: reverse transcriptase domain-containing protein [Candidatus Pacebacteria bacterium]|nr:reverse transcriptase domain-containing protein [Candidatus Paceibacterota bacterium]
MAAYSLVGELRKTLPLIAYKEARIPKKAGGFRSIFIPAPELKLIQRKIILRFLKKLIEGDRLIKINENTVVSWYNPRIYNESYARHAKLHSDSRFIFQFDIKDAFPSVSSARVREAVFKLMSYYPGIEIDDQAELADVIAELTTFKGILPQGAPTSPLLFFIVIISSGLYEKIFSLCCPEWIVSFYVDNFAVSGKEPVPEELKARILKCVSAAGFAVNEEKTRQTDSRQGVPLVTGIRVDGIKKRISLPKKAVRRWRGIIYRAARTKDPHLIKKAQGLVASLRPIYGDALPPQIAKPFALLKEMLNEPPKQGKKKTDSGSKYFYPVRGGVQARFAKWP